jgi:hypothetical protein
LICRWNGELGKLWYVDLVDFMGERVGEQVWYYWYFYVLDNWYFLHHGNL